MSDSITLKFSCPDQPRISATVFSFFANNDYNVLESSQHEDSLTGLFFMRTVFAPMKDASLSIDDLRKDFSSIATQYKMEWYLREARVKPKILIAATKDSNCMNNLLNAWQRGVLNVDVAGVVSNHVDLKKFADWYGVPFYHFPITKETKPQQEAQIIKCMKDNDVELLVLARYMQILSDNFCQQLVGRAINIHHSFLPGFKGAKPYHQAFERGVKLIGATAHFVTADLDEGPIIEQAVERISHANLPEELVETGRDIEAVVLNRAVKWYSEDRVMLNGKRTVVFRRS
ncbi:MAG: formyltetrahydrofolate deformylase [Kangiellaceae bacterium]|nr:formyltetrahydrofolate deformylase [Kangiellaceae bacterium]